jgi:siroheme decarboxylase
VFDSRRLGYKSMLCAIDADADMIDAVAAVVCRHPGVTHCYERMPYDGSRCYPSLWFTIAMLEDTFDVGMRDLQAQLPDARIFALPALQRFKIDVVFDLRPAAPTKPWGSAGAPRPAEFALNAALSGDERALVRLVSEQLPVDARPLDAIASQCGMPVGRVVAKLRVWQGQGVLRRIAPVLYHRAAGFAANGMCVWKVPGEVCALGRLVAAWPEVTHCYQRPRLPEFPFDLYAMIHAGSTEELHGMFGGISSVCGLREGVMLLSAREFKKSSMRYFEI